MNSRNPLHLKAISAALLCAVPLLLGSLCGGEGRRGQRPVLVQSADPDCAPLFGQFPPGLAVLPGRSKAVVVTGGPQTVIPFELASMPPANVGPSNPPAFPSDSDGDGEDDFMKSLALGFGVRTPILGRPSAVSDALVLVSASNYEEVLAYDPMTAVTSKQASREQPILNEVAKSS